MLPFLFPNFANKPNWQGRMNNKVQLCMFAPQIREQQKENERLWAAINRSTLREKERDRNGSRRSEPMTSKGGSGRRSGFTNHGGRSAGASV